MSTEPRLTDALHRRLAETVSDAYLTLFESCSDPDSAGFADAVADVLLGAVKEALALGHKRRNRRSSLQHRVPNELWCHIWSFLPFAARISVSHTCHAWRSVALSCRDLWTSVTFYTTAHASYCNCHDCDNDRFFGTHPTGWNLSPYQDGSTNIYSASEILGRSGCLPLKLTLVIVPYRADVSQLHALAQELDAHSARVAALHIRAADHSSAHTFLSAFTNLPSLEEISTEDLENDRGPVAQAVLLPPGLGLPALRALHLACGFWWPQDGGQYANLRALSIDLDELLPALAACPHLESLQVHLPSSLGIREFELQAVASDILPECLQSVSLISSCERRFGLALAMLHSPRLPQLAVKLEGDRVDVGTAAPIFADLTETVHLRLACRSGSLAVTGTDGHGRVRTVEYGSGSSPADLLDEFFNLSIDPRTVTTLTLSSCLVDHLAAFWPSLPSVLELEIIVGNEDTYADALAPSPQFPAVRAVGLLGDQCASTVSEQDVADLLLRLTLHLPLAALTIDHRIFEGPYTGLKTFAHAVHVGVCHI